MDYGIGKGHYPGVGITVKQKGDDGGKQSRSSSSSEEFSKKTQELGSHAEASITPAPVKVTSAIDKFADLPVKYEYLAKKWTIDLPEGTSAALACTLVDTIRRLRGEKEGDRHCTKLAPDGPPYQIRFSVENKSIGPEYIQRFVKLLIRGCEGLGIRDEAALARFLRK